MGKDKEIEAYLNHELSAEEMLKYEIAQEMGLFGPSFEQWVEKSFRKGDRAYRRTDYAKKKSSERVKAGSERTPDRI